MEFPAGILHRADVFPNTFVGFVAVGLGKAGHGRNRPGPGGAGYNWIPRSAVLFTSSPHVILFEGSNNSSKPENP